MLQKIVDSLRRWFKVIDEAQTKKAKRIIANRQYWF